MTRRTASDIGMPEHVAPETTALVHDITSLLVTDDEAMKNITILLSNFTPETLSMIRIMAGKYDTEHLLLMAQALRYEARKPLIHTIQKREVRATHLVAVVPIIFAFEEGGYSAPERGLFSTIPIEDYRRISIEVHIDHSMDGMIKTGREVHKVQGSAWIVFSRGMVTYQKFEQYKICGGSRDEFEYVMMLGENMERVVSMSENILDLRGRFGNWNGLNKEQIQHLVEGGAPALMEGLLA